MWGVLKSATQEFTTQLANDLANKNSGSGSGDDPFLQQQEEKPKVVAVDAKKLNIAPSAVIASEPIPPLKVGLKEQLAAASSKDEEDGGWDDEDWGQLLSDPPSAPADALPPAVPAPAALPNLAPVLIAVSQAVSSVDATAQESAEDEEDFWGTDGDWGQSDAAPAGAVQPVASTPVIAAMPAVSVPSESAAKAAASLVQAEQHLAAPNATSQDIEQDPWGNDNAWGSLLEDQPPEPDKVVELAIQAQASDPSVDSGPHVSDLSCSQGGDDVLLSLRAQHVAKGDAEDPGDVVSKDVSEGFSQLAPGIGEAPIGEHPISVEQDSHIRAGQDSANVSTTQISDLATQLDVQEGTPDFMSDVRMDDSASAAPISPLGHLGPDHADATLVLPAQAGRSELEVQKLTKLLDEASCSLSRSQDDLRKSNEKYADLEAKHSGVQAQHEVGTAAHMATQHELERLRAQLETASSERDTALCQVEVTRQDNEALVDKLSMANVEIERFRKVDVERDAQASELRNRLQVSEAECAELQRELVAVRGEVAEVSQCRDSEESDLGAKLQRSEAECSKLQTEAQSLRDACAQLKLEGQLRLSAVADSEEVDTCPADTLSARDAPRDELLCQTQREQASAETSPAWAVSLCTDVQDVVRLESERSRQTMSADLLILRDAMSQMQAELRRVSPQSPVVVVESCGQVDLL